MQEQGSNIIIKSDVRSGRVKGISFHPNLSMILMSLHNGQIQMWDYTIGSLVDRYEEHEGPVRGVDFHVSQPLFISGGDDHKINIWNYKFKKCVFTLLGHLDYIRTVYFHKEYPWVVSASDDQTVRIWNWQARSCISVMAGHGHYVMCAQFHPSEDMVISASLDMVVRIWDIGGLKDKYQSNRDYPNDIFGCNDVVCKFVLESHERGVNWAAFHPTLPLIATAADDRLIKLWRYTEAKAWEIETLRGHSNNVSAVVFHPTKELLLSDGEDKTIRIWDINKRMLVQTYRKESERFWILGSKSNCNLIAAGHDAGTIVFKINRDRPAFTVNGRYTYIVKDKQLEVLGRENKERYIASVKELPTVHGISRSVIYNTFNNMEINLCIFNRETKNPSSSNYETLRWAQKYNESNITSESVTTNCGVGLGLCYVSRNRYVVLDISGLFLLLYNINGEMIRKIPLSFHCDSIYPSLLNHVILKSDDKIYHYDVMLRNTVADMYHPGVIKHVIWDKEHTYCALTSKHTISFIDQKFKSVHFIHENGKIKSAVWEIPGILIYNTVNHLKYCIINGDRGIIHSLDAPIYLIRAEKKEIVFILRNLEVKREEIQSVEYNIKSAIFLHKYESLTSQLKNGSVKGKALICYLREKGYNELGLMICKDPLERFNMAMEIGNIAEILSNAEYLNHQVIWDRAAKMAMQIGDYRTVEMIYQRNKDLTKLLFLYFISGQMNKLKKMLCPSKSLNNLSWQYHNALYVGDLQTRIDILQRSKLECLAVITKETHGILPSKREGAMLRCPVPLGTLSKWPCEEIVEAKQANVQKRMDVVGRTVGSSKVHEKHETEDSEEDIEDLEDAWGDLDMDEHLEDTPIMKKTDSNTDSETQVKIGKTPEERWKLNTIIPADEFAAGNINEGLNNLRRRIALLDPEPLKPFIRIIMQSSQAYLLTMPESPPLDIPLLKSCCLKDDELMLRHVFNCEYYHPLVKEALRTVTSGHFEEAKRSFRHIIQSLALAVAYNDEQDTELKELLSMCKIYITAMRIEVERSKTQDMKRNVQLVTYFGLSELQPVHQILAMRKAISVAMKAENYLTAATLIRRFVKKKFPTINKSEQEIQKAKKVLAVAEAKATEKYDIEFDPSETAEPVDLCCKLLVHIKNGIKCPFCGSTASPKHEGDICETCCISTLGARALGVEFKAI